ncbi:redoxin domain-containing protein [Candidatus Pacearchaeota archaeon]|nr:redoxin domain-containing protein [Candidatus Pacearchaeota archaeon]
MIDKRKIILIIIIIFIIASIYFLQRSKTDISSEPINITQVTAESDRLSLARIAEKEEKYIRAPELQGITGYLNLNNTKITIQENIGKKIILIDFWTYSCINCQRTFPYLNAWWSRYKDKGLLIIGVHSPEFEFEKRRENVENAIKQFGIEYPVVQDNNFQTWRAYRNHYWPAKYFIDIDGFFVYGHFGEGDYELLENKIQELLEERAQILQEKINISKDMVKPETDSPDFNKIKTNEIYFGYDFTLEFIGNKEGFKPEQEIVYKLPEPFYRKENIAYIEGKWYNGNDHMELRSEAGKIALKFEAKKVNIVAGASTDTIINITLDSKPETKKQIQIKDNTLYNIVSLSNYSKHELQIDAQKGFQIYTFTFG